MVWACLAAAIVGLAIGLRFRVAFLLAAAWFMGGATIAVGLRAGWSIVHTLAVLLLVLAVTQVGYLIGLWAASRWRQRRALARPPSTTE